MIIASPNCSNSIIADEWIYCISLDVLLDLVETVMLDLLIDRAQVPVCKYCSFSNTTFSDNKHNHAIFMITSN